MPRAGTAGPGPNRCCVFCSVERDGLAVARLDQLRDRQRRPVRAGQPCAHRGNPAAARLAAAEPDSRSAWRRVSDVSIDMVAASLGFDAGTA